LENYRGDLYQVKEDPETGLPHRGKRRRDIEAFNDLTKKERYRRRADTEHQWNIPNSPIESFFETITAEKDASDAIRGQTIPDDVKVSPLDLPKNLQRFTPIATTSTLPPLHIPPTTKEMAEEFTTASDHRVPDTIVHQTFAPDGTNQQIREMKEKFLKLGKDYDKTPKKDRKQLPKKPPRPFNHRTVSWGPNDDPSDGDDSDEEEVVEVVEEAVEAVEAVEEAVEAAGAMTTTTWSETVTIAVSWEPHPN
jgi:hypothetical protein